MADVLTWLQKRSAASFQRRLEAHASIKWEHVTLGVHRGQLMGTARRGFRKRTLPCGAPINVFCVAGTNSWLVEMHGTNALVRRDRDRARVFSFEDARQVAQNYLHTVPDSPISGYGVMDVFGAHWTYTTDMGVSTQLIWSSLVAERRHSGQKQSMNDPSGAFILVDRNDEDAQAIVLVGHEGELAYVETVRGVERCVADSLTATLNNALRAEERQLRTLEIAAFMSRLRP